MARAIDGIWTEYLMLTAAADWGWVALTGISLIASPIACYLSGEAGAASTPAVSSPFWSAVASGLGSTFMVAVLGYAAALWLHGFALSRAVSSFNRLYPIGRTRDLGFFVMQERQRNLKGRRAARISALTASLGAGSFVPSEPPIETQLTESLETLAAQQTAAEEESATGLPEPTTAVGGPAGAAEDRRRDSWAGGVIPLEPEAEGARGSSSTGRRAEGSAGDEGS